MPASTAVLPCLVAGGGIGGLAAALALARCGLPVTVLEQAAELGEIGAGVQLGPNAFASFDALGVGERARQIAVYTERMVMIDAVDEAEVAAIPVGEAFRQRFGNPYAVVHRADAHGVLLDAVRRHAGIELVTSCRVAQIAQDAESVTVHDAAGRAYRGSVLVGADGVKSVVRARYVRDPVRVSGHVVYRAVVDARDFPAELRWNAPTVWAGPDCHLVHYPLRGGEQYNLVVTFHSREAETWGVRDGSAAEVQSYFDGVGALPRRLLALPKSWRRWATGDREPLARWSHQRATLLGDAAHPMLQYIAQGACMALEDAVSLGAAMAARPGEPVAALALYEAARVTRTARVLLSAREMGRLYHASGVQRQVRNDLWKGRSPERFYDALEWLYGWRAETCLAAAEPPRAALRR